LKKSARSTFPLNIHKTCCAAVRHGQLSGNQSLPDFRLGDWLNPVCTGPLTDGTSINTAQSASAIYGHLKVSQEFFEALGRVSLKKLSTSIPLKKGLEKTNEQSI
jgi:hypothetical protein